MDSIIFDLDGTLWDSCESVKDSWNITLQKYPVITKKLTLEDIQSIMGLVVEDIGKKLFYEAGEDECVEIAKICCEEECAYIAKYGAHIYDGLQSVLEILSKEYKLFIVSNCQNGYIEAFFDYTGYGHYFTDYLCSGMTGKQKGHNIQTIIKKNNLTEPIYVGDTIGDFNGAKEANIPFVYASYGFGMVEDTISISNIKELPYVLTNIR